MKLLLIKGWAGTEELISDEPTEEKISELIGSLNWHQINSVRPERDAMNRIDISGT